MLLMSYFGDIPYVQASGGISRPSRGRSRPSSSSTHVKSKLPRERYSTNLLYSSSDNEEDNHRTSSIPKSKFLSTAQTISHHRSSSNRVSLPSDCTNPFENFTVSRSTGTSERQQGIRSKEITAQKSKNRLPVSSTVAISGHSSHFNPLGQVEGCVPALIPESEDKESGRSSSRDNDGDLPLIDDWLVDDMSSAWKDQPPAKRRKHQASSGASRREIRSFLEGSTSLSSGELSHSGGGRQKNSLQRKNRTASTLHVTERSHFTSRSDTNDSLQGNNEGESSHKKRKTIVVEDSSSDSDERFLDSVICTEEDIMDSDSTMSASLASATTVHPQSRGAISMNTINSAVSATSTPPWRFGSVRPLSRTSREQSSSLFPYQSASSSHQATCGGSARIDSTAAFNQIQTTPASQHAVPIATSSSSSTSYSDVPPLRVRVKIESKLYLIPCPRKDVNGLDTTIQWLVSQASERHYAQQGVRPCLSLTTSDGAILSPTDLVRHVLSPNEEVVGVVEGWMEETLEERYLAACKKERVGE